MVISERARAVYGFMGLGWGLRIPRLGDGALVRSGEDDRSIERDVCIEILTVSAKITAGASTPYYAVKLVRWDEVGPIYQLVM